MLGLCLILLMYHRLQSTAFSECGRSATFRNLLLFILIFGFMLFELFNSVNSWRLFAQLYVESRIFLVDLLELFSFIYPGSGLW